MRDITQLHPELQAIIPRFLAKCMEEGLIVGISECYRTVAEQDALYAKGRTAPGSIVTNCKGSSYSSPHQWGVAFDFYRNDGKGAYCDSDNFFYKVGQIGKSLGLQWGGDFKTFKDTPHLQLAKFFKDGTVKYLKATYGTPTNFMKTWGKVNVPNTESEELTLSQYDELVKLINELKETITQNQPKVYHYTKDVPEWGRDVVQRALDKGIVHGASDSDLNLTETEVKNLVYMARLGLI